MSDILLPARACRVCGCTDDMGCKEICHWVEPDLCSVCAGVTPMRPGRHYTRTRQALEQTVADMLTRLGWRDDVIAGLTRTAGQDIAVMNPRGTFIAYTPDIAHGQRLARELDAADDRPA